MASIKAFDPVSVPLSVLEEVQQLRALVEQLRQENARLRRENDRLRGELDAARASLDQAQRQAKRQAAPFSKGPPKSQPKKPGRKAGKAHGRHGHRLPPGPAVVDEILEAPLPETCPHCGGAVRQTGVAAQYQTEIPRRPLIRQFNVHLGVCSTCDRRVQGQHPLQTSDALGAAASQIGPDAQAAMVLLNKTFGLSHIKVAAVFQALFGITLTRGASAQIVLRAENRSQPAYEEVRQEIKSAACLTPDETGWRVAGQPTWLHAWVAERATCYAIDPHRKADVLERLIGIAWSGRMVHDGFASYDRFEAATHQQCLGHLLRRVRDLEAKATRGAVHYPRKLIGIAWSGRMVHDGFASYDRFEAATHQQCLGHLLRRVRDLEAKATRGAVHYPRKLIALFTEAIHLRNRSKKGEVSAEQLAPARKVFDGRLRDLAWPAREVPAYETLSGHLWQHLDEWFTFLSHPEIEPTNLGGGASDPTGGGEPEGLGWEPHLGGCSRPGSADVRAGDMQASRAFWPGLRQPDPARLRQSFAPTPDSPHPALIKSSGKSQVKTSPVIWDKSRLTLNSNHWRSFPCPVPRARGRRFSARSDHPRSMLAPHGGPADASARNGCPRSNWKRGPSLP